MVNVTHHPQYAKTGHLNCTMKKQLAEQTIFTITIGITYSIFVMLLTQPKCFMISFIRETHNINKEQNKNQ